MTAKVVNYTKEMTERLHEVYDSAASQDARDVQVAQLAEELGKSAASIRMKLTREGVYVAKVKEAKGKARVKKSDLVSVIASKLETDEDVVGSLEKATTKALTLVADAL